MPKILNTLRRIFCVFGFFLFFFCFACEKKLQSSKDIPTSEPDKGVIVVVYDGDTVGVEFPDGRRRKIRFIGIDSPETGHSDEQVRLLAQLSKRFTFYYLYGKQVTLKYDWEREDKYGRLLAYIWTEENGLFNEFILEEGFASAYLQFPFKDEYRKRFTEAEKAARLSNKGLWREEPYPAVSPEKISDFLGQTGAVQYICQDVKTKGQFIYLFSAAQIFSTLIPKNKKNLFGDVEDFKGRIIRVQGFVEEYKEQPQIIAFFPRQIKAAGSNIEKSVKKETPL